MSDKDQLINLLEPIPQGTDSEFIVAIIHRILTRNGDICLGAEQEVNVQCFGSVNMSIFLIPFAWWFLWSNLGNFTRRR